ncbi:MAG: hypothetical protein EXS32_14720 [Opitutus sp.]|nr:hypothetical protein [Opitutus sp.]
MFTRLLALFTLGVISPAADAEITLPARPPEAATGEEFAARLTPLDLAAREAAVIVEVKRGNVPGFWRRFVEVKIAGASFFGSPEYLCIGADDDFLLMPVTPATAQLLADFLGCVLPTRKMVDAIYRAAPLKLTPSPLPPSAAMTTVPVFAEHNAIVREQRMAALASHPPGTLVAGHKKDVVLTPQLATSPGKVAIYGWHRPDGVAIQPLYLGHTASWVDYSHGVRLVRREMTVNGAPTTVAAVLADAKLSTLLSDEGVITEPRYREVRAATLPTYPSEIFEELNFEPGVRVVLNSPAQLDPTKPVRLILYALPAGNTIEQTIGRQTKPGDDWHFDIQHIGAQTRWLRAHIAEANLVVAYLQSAERSFVLWRRAHPDHPQRSGEIVDALRRKFAQPKIVLTGHSAGGSFTFSYLDSLEHLPDDIERIAFLDSNYAYDAAKAHGAKLTSWLGASETHRLCVLAYQDYIALLDGKTFVSENGGTWGRSQAMLRDLTAKFPFARNDHAGLQRHVALGGRVEFLLKENPEKAILHTRQVELNGFIHAMLAGTARAGQGYEYLGTRAYTDWIGNE